MLDFNARKKWRTQYPGACAIGYESIIQNFIAILIGWDYEKNKGRNGIFGMPQVYADYCEDQARFTLHSHVSIWIKNFYETRNLLFHESKTIRQEAKRELELYFDKIAQATFSEIYGFDMSPTSTP